MDVDLHWHPTPHQKAKNQISDWNSDVRRKTLENDSKTDAFERFPTMVLL